MSSSPDEGEIRSDACAENNKAIHQNSQHAQSPNGVDRLGRTRDQTPIRDSASRGSGSSRPSPSPRGYKRTRDEGDWYDGRPDYDSRRSRRRRDDEDRQSYPCRPSRSHDEAPRDSFRRSRISYEDLDRPEPQSSKYHDFGQQNSRHDQYRSRDGDRPLPRTRHGACNRDRGRDRAREQSGYRRSSRRRSRSPQPARDDKSRHVRFVPQEHQSQPDTLSASHESYADSQSRGNIAANGSKSGTAPLSKRQVFLPFYNTPYFQPMLTGHSDSARAKPFDTNRHGSKGYSNAKSVDSSPRHRGQVESSSEQRDGSGLEPGKDSSPETQIEPAQAMDEDAEIERRRRRREEIWAKCSTETALPTQDSTTQSEASVGEPRISTRARHENQANMEQDRDDVPEALKGKLDGDSLCSESRLATKETRQPTAEGARPEAELMEKSISTGLSQVREDEKSVTATPRSPMGEASPGTGQMADYTGLMNTHGAAAEDDNDGPSAADYDPVVDMAADERRDERRHGQAVLHGEPQPLKGAVPAPQQSDTDKENEEDDFDMFAEDFDPVKYAAHQQKRGRIEKTGLLQHDDQEGFYKVRIGEVIGDRYEAKAVLGRGMFARVVRAIDTKGRGEKLVAIKMIRNNDALRRAAHTEIAILRKLNDADTANKKFIVRFEQSFDHQSHLCMVFENLDMNLREVLQKFGRNVGINLEATRRFAKQIFIGLDHLRKNHIIHADLKPDNIVINERRSIVKICDLGTAIDRDDAATAHSEVTPYLVSRFYRAPEVILGMDYDYAIDIWSIGCTLFELFTGKILFPGESNNQMLKVIMEARGRMYPRYYKRGKLWNFHFDDKDNFVSTETDHISRKEIQRHMTVKQGRSVAPRLEAASTGMSAEQKAELDHFKELMEGCLMLHAERRLTPEQALKHAFFTKTRP
ncbi:hypothetical protein CDD81_2386 [Ophiocordyceps australis]|uniref:non-specific serine/threonine protein kinase n=1 Tax=Ophiocordyceps australis TaxID=1399860 RepID=A0A2C5XEQ2_9HYPO|nr:hypothetical protein CDD81_2386 [Ophiocordyceps australis]